MELHDRRSSCAGFVGFNSQECAASRTLAEPKSTGPEGTLVEQYHPKPHVSGYFLLAVDPWEGLEAVHA